MKRSNLLLPVLAIAALTAATTHGALLAFDDFSTYTTGNLNAQSGGGSLTGFGTTTWTANTVAPAVQVTAGGVLQQGANKARSWRNFSTPPLASSGTIYLRTTLAISNADVASNFSALELATTANSDANSIRLTGSSLGMTVNVNGAGGASSGVIAANDAGSHVWLVELNLTTKAGKAWIDGNLASFNPTVGAATFTAPTTFSLNAINVATFAANSFINVDEIRIGQSWADIGVTAIPEPSSLALLGLGGLALLRRRR
jgi:hypothetical protein